LSGKKSACVNKRLGEIAHVFEFPLNKLIENTDTLGWVVLSADLLLENVDRDSKFILSLTHDNEVYFYETQFLIHQIHNENLWKNVRFYFKIPEMKSLDDKIMLSLSNNNSSSVWVDNLELTFYSPK
jgi:hypothetical protein